MRTWILTVAAGAAIAWPASAQMEAASAPAECEAMPAPPPAEMAGWSARKPMTAAKSPSQLKQARLTVGEGVDAALSQTSEVHYALRPEKPGGSVSYGGLFAFTVASAGTYRVALGSGAWIDVIARGKASLSGAHGHGPACTGIRKMVDFPLAPGDYVLQIAANGAPSLPLLVTRLP